MRAYPCAGGAGRAHAAGIKGGLSGYGIKADSGLPEALADYRRDGLTYDTSLSVSIVGAYRV